MANSEDRIQRITGGASETAAALYPTIDIGQEAYCPFENVKVRRTGTSTYTTFPDDTKMSSAISTASTADRARANHTGTQTASTISDLSTAVPAIQDSRTLPTYGVKTAVKPGATPFTKATRTFTIPSGWVFRLGYEDFTAGALSVVIPNVAGEYLIYFDVATKTLMATTGERPAWSVGILVCRLVYSQVSADEISMIWETHGVRTKYDDDDAEAKHKCIGSMAEISNRPLPADLTINGSVIGVSTGYMWDEDKRSQVPTKTGSSAIWAKFYYNGLTVESKNKMERFPADVLGATFAQLNQIYVKDSDVGLGATGRAVFNNVTGTPVLQTIAATSAMLMHIFSSDGILDCTALVVGQKEYTGSNFNQAVQAAREGCYDEIKSIKMSEGSARDAYHVGSVIINATGQIQYVDAAGTQLYIPSSQTIAGATGGGSGATPTLQQVMDAGNTSTTAMVLSNNLTLSGAFFGSGLYTYGPASANTIPCFGASKILVSSLVQYDSTTNKMTPKTSDATAAGFNIAHGIAPSSPVNGDVWTTSAGGLFYQINGATKNAMDLSTAQSVSGTKTFATSGIVIGNTIIAGGVTGTVTLPATAGTLAGLSATNAFTGTLSSSGVSTFSNTRGIALTGAGAVTTAGDFAHDSTLKTYIGWIGSAKAYIHATAMSTYAAGTAVTTTTETSILGATKTGGLTLGAPVAGQRYRFFAQLSVSATVANTFSVRVKMSNATISNAVTSSITPAAGSTMIIESDIVCFSATSIRISLRVSLIEDGGTVKVWRDNTATTVTAASAAFDVTVQNSVATTSSFTVADAYLEKLN